MNWDTQHLPKSVSHFSLSSLLAFRSTHSHFCTLEPFWWPLGLFYFWNLMWVWWWNPRYPQNIFMTLEDVVLSLRHQVGILIWICFIPTLLLDHFVFIFIPTVFKTETRCLIVDTCHQNWQQTIALFEDPPCVFQHQHVPDLALTKNIQINCASSPLLVDCPT